MTADLTFEQLASWIRDGEVESITAALVAADEPARRALATPLRGLTAVRQPYVEGLSHQGWLRLMERRRAALQLAGAGCLTSASTVVTWLRNLGGADDPALVRVLSAPGRPSLAAVARGMATRLRPDLVDFQWRLISRLLDAAGEPVPPTEATVRGWLRETGCSAESLRGDPRTGHLLPHVFAIPRVGGDVSPGGLANLTELRDVILPGCVARLADGDRPGAIRSFVQLHGLLQPTAEELSEHRQAYLAMLDSPHSTVVDLGLRALRAVDDPELVADAALSVLPRPEKKLVRAQLDWIDAVLARGPDPVLFEALLTGLGNESVDLAERTVRVIAKHLPSFPSPAAPSTASPAAPSTASPAAASASTAAFGQVGGLGIVGDFGASGSPGGAGLLGETAVERLARAAEGLSGDLRRQVIALLPAGVAESAPSAPDPLPVAAGSAVAGLEPIRSLPEVAAAAIALVGFVDRDPIQLEQVLDGLVRYAHTDRAALAAALGPKLPNWSDPYINMLRAVVDGTWTPWTPNQWERHAAAPFWMLTARLEEIARRMTTAAGAERQRVPRLGPPALLATPATVDGHLDPARVPALLATPATVDGHVDPVRVLTLLAAAERDGWEPGVVDLAQAVLRLPRELDPGVLAAAERLTGPAGRFFAAWVRGGGLPDPVVVTGEAIWHGCPDPGRCTCQWPFRQRWTSSFSAIPLPVPRLATQDLVALGLPALVPATPGRTAPDLPAPGPFSPSLPVPGTAAAPGLAALGMTVPEAAVPEAAVPGATGARAAVLGLAVPEGLLAASADPDRTRGRRSMQAASAWPMMFPSHPEIVATHALPEFLGAVEDGYRYYLGLLPVLAASAGPFGPALALGIGLGFSADRPAGRVLATDAFVEVAARGKLDAALLGRELANLQRDGRVTAKRVAGCLTEAIRAGLATEVWAVLRELLPAALTAPGPGTPDLLATAESAAAAVHASDDIPEVTELAARTGRTRLITEAARLARTLTGNRQAGGA
ncbi:hypothetical protein [Actinoplanes sp. L3-i22]|uniref:hypothetical protein n=1 Tax=Actinoplanes sp. L3-i22 TaxID=2836373 RepID=UPI002714A6DB|nr:hypothetical protein [Actinoplanes sp. L3-i22]